MPKPKNKKDKYETFVLSLPFCRIKIQKYEKQIRDAHVECGNEGWVTLDALAN